MANMSDPIEETTRAHRQSSTDDIRVLLASAAHETHDLSVAVGRAGLHTAASGWEKLRDDINALLVRARKLPK